MFFKGVGIGLGLALLVGPLIVLLLQLALREGQQAAWVAGFGIWVSDLAYAVLAHFGTDQLRAAIDWPGFEPVISMVGGAILIGVGIKLYRSDRKWEMNLPKAGKPTKKRKRKTSLVSAFWKGFAINTFNPFPVVFWSTVALTLVHDEGLSSGQAFALYAGILSTIVVSDSAKIWSAKWLRQKMASGWLSKVGQIGGVMLVVFGVVLVVRVWLA